MLYLFIGIVSVFLFTATILILKKTKLEVPTVSDNHNIQPYEGEEFDPPWLVKIVDDKELSFYDPPKKIELTDNMKNSIGSLMKITNSANEIVNKEKKVILAFKPEIANGLKSGELQLLKPKGSTNEFFAIAKDNKGKFAGQGRLEIQEVKSINPAKLANAALGVMSIVTAQEYLDRINQQLTNIDRKMDRLFRNIKNEKYGISKGNLEYLKSIFSGLDRFSEAEIIIYRNQIQSTIRESYQEVEKILRELPSIIEEVSKLDVKAMFKLEGNHNKISELIHNFGDFVSLALCNLEVMAISLKINHEMAGESLAPSLLTLQNVEHYLNQIRQFEKEFKPIVSTKVSNLNAWFRREKSISERQDKLNETINILNETITSGYSDIENIKDDQDLFLNSPFDLQIEYDDIGNMIAVYKLGKSKIS